MAGDKPEEGWVEHPSFTGRPQKEPLPNTTFAERAKANAKAGRKAAVEDAETKSVKKVAKK